MSETKIVNVSEPIPAMLLHDAYALYEIPKEIKMFIIKGISPFGTSLNKNKIALFVTEKAITREQAYEYIYRTDAREVDESFVSYKNRLKFAKQLFKHRTYFFKNESELTIIDSESEK